MTTEAQGTSATVTIEQTTAPAPDKPRVKADELPPDALKARLEAEAEKTRRAVLAELGVTDTKDAKAALDELKKRRDAEKTEQERLTARVAELEAQAARAGALSTIIAGRAASELGALSDKTRAYVTAEAGDDPARQLATIDRMRASGLLDAAPVAPPAAPAPAPPATPAAPAVRDTLPSRGAPADAATGATVDHRAEWERLQKINPIAAAAYGNRYAADVFVPKT